MNDKAVNTKAKRQAAKKKAGMGELLGLLKTHPHLVRALIFDHAKVKRLLKTKAARRLIPGVNPGDPMVIVEHRDGSTPPNIQIFRCLKRSNV